MNPFPPDPAAESAIFFVAVAAGSAPLRNMAGLQTSNVKKANNN